MANFEVEEPRDLGDAPSGGGGLGLGDFEPEPVATEDLPDRLAPHESIQQTIQMKQAELQALGLELQLAPQGRSTKDIEAELKRVDRDLRAQAQKKMDLMLRSAPTYATKPATTFPPTKANLKLQSEINEKLFGNPLAFRSQVPPKSMRGWNYTRVNLGASVN